MFKDYHITKFSEFFTDTLDTFYNSDECKECDKEDCPTECFLKKLVEDCYHKGIRYFGEYKVFRFCHHKYRSWIVAAPDAATAEAFFLKVTCLSGDPEDGIDWIGNYYYEFTDREVSVDLIVGPEVFRV